MVNEIKGRIKLDDESLHFFYKKDGWEYWAKTTAENNYAIQLRKKIGDNKKKAQELSTNAKLHSTVGQANPSV